MPRYEFECPRRHVTERIVPLSKYADLPKKVKCVVHIGGPGSTHYEGCAGNGKVGPHICGEWARRREVYTVGVGGDLPTRGAF